MSQATGTINTGSIGADLGQDELRKWVEEWTRFMVEIWVNRINGNRQEFGVKWEPIFDDRTSPSRHTWPHLNSAVKNTGLTFADPNLVAAGLNVTFQMPLYGLYVDMGVGAEFGLQKREGGRGMNRYGKGNPNKLGGKFLPGQPGMKMRREGGYEKWSPKREARQWFSAAWGRSVRALVDRLTADIGFNFARLFDDMNTLLQKEKKQMLVAAALRRKEYAKQQRRRHN